MSEFTNELFVWRSHINDRKRATLDGMHSLAGRSNSSATDFLRERLEPDIVGPCLGWMEQRGLWKRHNKIDGAQADVVATLAPLVRVEEPEPAAGAPVSRLALLASVSGLLAGGIVGYAVSELLDGGWAVAVLAAAGGSTLAVTTSGSWVNSETTKLPRPLTKWTDTLMPAPRPAPSRAAIRRAMEAGWDSAADLAFAECMLHPDRLRQEAPKPLPPPGLPIGLDQVTDLADRLKAEPIDREEIVETARDLVDLFMHAGWTWHWVEPGTS